MVQDFEITQDGNFLKHFYDKRDITHLSPKMVERLRKSEDPYGQYGYGQWLCRTQNDKESLKRATACFKYAASQGIADATQMLAVLYTKGDFYDEQRDILVLDRDLAQEFTRQAIEQGSEYAKIHRNYELFYGTDQLEADPEAAIAEAERESELPGASLLWVEQLGWYYEDQHRNEEAIRVYEKCIAEGFYYVLYPLAEIYLKQGDTERHEALLREGIEREVGSCMTWGYEKRETWDELDPEEQTQIHNRLEKNLQRGVELGNTGCIWALASLYIAADMGFERDLPKALELARMGMRLHDESCCYMIVYIQEKEELASTLPEELRLSKEELLMIKFIGLRYGDQEMLDEVIGNRSYFEKMGYGEEIERYWLPKWERENDLVDDDSTTPAEPVVVKPVVKQKTEIVPTVLVIQPSGFTDFVEADIYSMSFRQMADLIDAEGVDAVHFSTPLNQITKSCGLKRQLTMYVDREGVMKGLEENPAATLLYGDSFPIRGAVIIAMEDRRYDTYSFDTEEDIEEVFEAIFDLTGGRLMRDIGQEDGRYDPWA